MQGPVVHSHSSDLLVTGRILTLDAARPQVAAFGVRGGIVVATGAIADVRNALRTDHRRIHVASGVVVPGLIDAHVHLVDGGLYLAALDLAGVASRESWNARVRGHLADSHGAENRSDWVTGGGWDHERWGGVLPGRDWLDSLTGDRPALLMRSDLHIALANTAALERAGIDATATTADPPGGQILRDASGRPTGVLRDTAIELIARHIPTPSHAELDAALARATAHAHRHGVTQVHDKGELPPSWRDLEVLERAEAANRLSLRVSVATPVSDWQALAERVRARGRGSDLLQWGSVKGFVDGSLGAGTARFHTPFDDLPDTRGLFVTDPDELQADIRGAWGAGLQPITHAIGDAAVDWLIDVYADLPTAAQDRLPPRIEHAQHLSQGVAARMASAGVIASMQPIHLVADAPWMERRLGPKRAAHAYPVRTLADAGVPLALGSDWTVAPLDPLLGMRAARHRLGADGEVFGAAECVSMETALRGYTTGAAAAAGFRGRTGQLTLGALADFVVIDGVAPNARTRDGAAREEGAPYDPYEGLGEGYVVRTFVGGREVYRRETE